MTLQGGSQMIKITAIAPYEEFIDLFKKIFNEHNEYMHDSRFDQYEYELEVILAYGPDDINIFGLYSDVIVARGTTAYKLINKDYYIPVVEVPVAGNDLIHSLDECRRLYGYRKVAVMGSKSMIMGIESLSGILGMEIKSFILESKEDIEPQINTVISQGIDVVMAGVNTVEYAKNRGLKTVLIKSGRESIWQAISEAKRVAYISRREQEKARLFKTILDYTHEGIIAFDKEKKISVLNSASEDILGIRRKNIVGRNINDVVPNSKFTDFINTDKEYIDEIIKYNNTQLAIKKVPIVLKGENIGSLITFQNAKKIQEMEGRIRERIYTQGHVARHTFKDIIGKSEKINDVIKKAKKFSEVDSNILITGETGTGKEVFAQSIHNYSPRKRGPFVAVNCAALPESILESELFGYVEGAFTGAAKGGKLGLFELAHRGTIFLDEVSEIPPKLQGRLLRVIQEKEIMRLGHDRVIPIDVRVIAATNKKLQDYVKKGEFREDLYYRLNTLKLFLPPLRERKEDIMLMIESFIESYGLQFRKERMTITKTAKKMLQNYRWPGNVRELRNICEELVVLSQCNIIDEKDVEAILPGNEESANAVSSDDKELDYITRFNEYIDRAKKLEKEKIKNVLEEVGYSKVKAAEALGVSRTTLWRRMKELKLI